MSKYTMLAENLERELNYMDINNEIERIVRIMKISKEKKLALIEYHLRTNYNLSVKFSSIEELTEYLLTVDDENIIIDIYEVLDQNFSLGDPFFIFEFKLYNGKYQNHLKLAIETELKKDEEVSPNRDDNFTYIKRISEVNSIDNDYLSFIVKYERYSERRVSLTEVERGVMEYNSTFEIYFDFKSNLCYFKCGDNNQLGCASKVLKRKIIGIFERLEGVNFHRKQQSKTIFSGEVTFDKHTIIIITF